MEVCKVTPSTGKGYPAFVQQEDEENGQNEPVGRPAALPEVAQHMHRPKNPHSSGIPTIQCSNRVLNKKVKDGLKFEESGMGQHLWAWNWPLGSLLHQNTKKVVR